MIGHTADFFHRTGISELSVRICAPDIHQDVDTGHVGVSSHGHVILHQARPGPIMLPVVPRKMKVVRSAVFGVRLRPAFDEKMIEGGVVIISDFAPVTRLLDEGGQVKLQIIAPYFLEHLKESRRVTQRLASNRRSDMRLVLEHAWNGFPEFLAYHTLVGIHCDF